MRRMDSSRYWFCCCWCFLILFPVASNGQDDSCAFFETYGKPVSAKVNPTVILHFSVINNCGSDAGAVVNMNVRRKTDGSTSWIIMCNIDVSAEECNPTPGCTCDSQTGQFTVISRDDALLSQQWELNGKLKSGARFRKLVQIYVTTTHTFDTQTPPNDITSNHITSYNQEVLSTLTTPGESSSVRPLVSGNVSGVVLPASLGGILILVLAVLVRVEIARRKGLRGMPRNLHPPSPYPHVFQRPAPDAVAFRIQPDVEDSRQVSILSVQNHFYEVMPGEDSTSSGVFVATASSPVSHSTTYDDSLLHIACPSSDSSLPGSYLRPVSFAEEAFSKPEMTGESITHLYENNKDTSTAPPRADPPYQNMVNAQ